jgi:hypothetical protein
MRGHRAAPLLPPILTALAIAALTLYAYRDLAARPFAADDYQWLLNVRGLSFAEVARKAFDPGAQSHFFRPLIWLLFWAQTRAFGLDPRGFHAVSLALHLLNAALLGGLASKLRIENVELRMPDRTRFRAPQFSIFNSQFAIPLLAIATVALHPAPFEAVVWISAQSELLAAALLLVALHFWLIPRTKNQESRTENREPRTASVILSSCHLVTALLTTLALGLALLAKESAVIGLPLLMLLGRGRIENREPRTKNRPPQDQPRTENRESRTENRPPQDQPRTENQKSVSYKLGTTIVARFSIFNSQFSILNFTPYLLPTLVTLAYVALQIEVERRNYLLAQGGYGFGPQVLLNPLRSLALIIAPLPGTEHADATWLVPLGAVVVIGLIGWTIYDLRFTIRRQPDKSSIVHRRSSTGLVLALALTLLPTAPFASPPDSRYLYLPVMAAALLVGFAIYGLRFTIYERRAWSPVTRHPSLATRHSPPVTRHSSLVTGLLVLVLAWWASGELHAREGRFAAASGPGGSLWRVATSACAEARPERMVVVEPPVATPHVEAIIGLACGPDVRTKIVGRDQIAGAIKGRTVVIAFPNGSAEVQQQT